MTAGRIIAHNRVTNADKNIIELLTKGGPRRVDQVVAYFYRTTKQPQKKAKTFGRHLRRLQRAGKVDCCEGLWFVPGSGPKGGRRLRLAA